MLLELRKITAVYETLHAMSAQRHIVLKEADLSIAAGEIVGLLGESGSGKSTLGRVAAGLLRPSAGEVRFHGQRVQMPYRGALRRRIQMLVQHPETALNPRLKILRSMKEPYEIYRLPYAYAELLTYLRQFGIYEEHLDKYPQQVSGGEIQRICLARTLLLEPKLLILDEATSMLDVISQAQIIELLRQLHDERQTAMLFITHDAVLAEAFCHRIYYIEGGMLRQ